MTHAVAELMRTIQERRDAPATLSYTNALMSKGLPAILAKIEEESHELIEAAKEPVGPETDQHLIHEIADLVYHVVVLLGHRELDWKLVELELQRRAGTSGLVEKASRTRPQDP